MDFQLVIILWWTFASVMIPMANTLSYTFCLLRVFVVSGLKKSIHAWIQKQKGFGSSNYTVSVLSFRICITVYHLCIFSNSFPPVSGILIKDTQCPNSQPIHLLLRKCYVIVTPDCCKPCKIMKPNKGEMCPLQ
jgi:hypothetical protein